MIMFKRLLISFDTVTLSNSTRIMVGIYVGVFIQEYVGM